MHLQYADTVKYDQHSASIVFSDNQNTQNSDFMLQLTSGQPKIHGELKTLLEWSVVRPRVRHLN